MVYFEAFMRRFRPSVDRQKILQTGVEVVKTLTKESVLAVRERRFSSRNDWKAILL